MRPRSSSSTCSCSIVKPRTYTHPAQMPSTNTNAAASSSADIDAAVPSENPATNTATTNTHSFGTRRWNTEMVMTPPATPRPRAKISTPKPDCPAPSTWSANTGPSGTSIPPPISPVARPRFTARTTGLRKTNCQPSRSSRQAAPNSIRLAPRARSAFRRRGNGSDQIMSAESRNVPASK